ncbi:hypothetical protein [Larkinella soli]|uniref:hypothetical protein n=1 Tax=Larkinella soli TaxID=1770527 RepID=UPI000FFBFD55|nr:hypothetical protein [Larkinella soli]
MNSVLPQSPSARKQDTAGVPATNLFVVLTFFSYGTAMMDYFLVYPSRAIVGAGEFVAYHALLEDRILPISVVPFALMTVLNLLLLWYRPADVPKGLIRLSLLCLLLDWASSILVQIPMNLQLNEGKDLLLIQQVMDTNYGRIFLESAQALIAFLILNKRTRQPQ